ncbi:MAG TPA: DeoR/GlpR family DNA-binding transcription regulator [Ardenticatenaceae bacterium]|jgi:DeoR/GlpR family transcriptional regulator of sugar metabolism
MMLPPLRRQRILEDIAHLGVGLVPELSEKYGVSEMTIRRDLKVLEENGFVQRTHGGAIRRTVSLPEPRIIARENRQSLYAQQKNSIAKYAASALVADSDILILEGGTTVTAMIQYLVGRTDLTVVTNGLDATNELHRLMHPSTTIICAGGILRTEASTFVGPVAERFFQEFHANRVFLSATGLTLKTGVTDPSMLETQVKRAMLSSASEVVMLLDSSKFGVKSLMTVLDLNQIDILVTDENCPEEMSAGLKERGVDLRIAPNL